jgi:hypothetical protein
MEKFSITERVAVMSQPAVAPANVQETV